MAVIGSTFVLFPRFYFALFNPKDAAFSADELIHVGRLMLIIMTSWGFFDAVAIVLSDALKGAGDTRFVMLFLAFSGWILLIPGAILLLHCGYGIIALWLWLAVYILFIMVGNLWRWCSGHWKKIQVIESEAIELLPITDEVH
jgi:MATE family multidrug resistance protein